MNYTNTHTNSRKQIIFTGVLCGLLIGFVTLAAHMGRVFAAACTPPSTDYGTVSKTVSIPSTGTYYIWSRLQAPDTTNNSYLLEVDGNTCYTVGDTNITPNTWTWINYQNGNTGSRISQNLSAGNHTIKMIGREPGVRLDLLLFTTDSACTPSGNGSNCIVLPDTTAPTVNITAPSAGATVSGTTTLAADASDAVGVTKVEFYIDGQLLDTDTTGPSYQASWATTGVANGSHSIAAKAYDAAGNSKTSTTVNVTVNNVVTPPPDTTAPTVTILNPGNNSSVNGTVGVTVQATDNVGVSKVEVYLGNTLLGTAAASGGNFMYSWNTTSLADGAQTLRAKAYDAAGNVTTSSIINVTVNNAPPPDTTAPSVPTNLSSSNITTTGARISWSASTDTGGSNLAGYYIYRGGQQVGTVGPATASFADSGLSASTQYSYTVRAYDGAGNVSSASTVLRVTTATPPDVIAPSVPAGLRSTGQTTSSVALAWDASTDNVAVTAYKVYRNGTLVGTVATTSYNDTGLQANTAYSYTVSAVDAESNESAKSAALTQRTQTPPDTTAPTAPGNVKAVANNQTSVTVSWNASTDAGGIAKYYVQRSTGGTYSTIGETSGLSLADNTALAGTTYNYRVVAVDASNNNSSPSAVVSVTTPAAQNSTPPPAPQEPQTIAVSSRQINLYWKTVANVQKFTIKRNGTTLIQVAGTVTSYGDTTAQPGSTYTYEIIAVDGSDQQSTATSIQVSTPSVKRLGDIIDRGDDKIDIFDLSALITQLNKQSPDLKTDLNGDGKVNIFDLSNVLSRLGT